MAAQLDLIAVIALAHILNREQNSTQAAGKCRRKEQRKQDNRDFQSDGNAQEIGLQRRDDRAALAVVFNKIDRTQHLPAAHHGRRGARLDRAAVIAAVKDVVALQRADDLRVHQEFSLRIACFQGIEKHGPRRVGHDRPRRAQVLQRVDRLRRLRRGKIVKLQKRSRHELRFFLQRTVLRAEDQAARRVGGVNIQEKQHHRGDGNVRRCIAELRAAGQKRQMFLTL